MTFVAIVDRVVHQLKKTLSVQPELVSELSVAAKEIKPTNRSLRRSLYNAGTLLYNSCRKRNLTPCTSLLELREQAVEVMAKGANALQALLRILRLQRSRTNLQTTDGHITIERAAFLLLQAAPRCWFSHSNPPSPRPSPMQLAQPEQQREYDHSFCRMFCCGAVQHCYKTFSECRPNTFSQRFWQMLAVACFNDSELLLQKDEHGSSGAATCSAATGKQLVLWTRRFFEYSGSQFLLSSNGKHILSRLRAMEQRYQMPNLMVAASSDSTSAVVENPQKEMKEQMTVGQDITLERQTAIQISSQIASPATQHTPFFNGDQDEKKKDVVGLEFDAPCVPTSMSPSSPSPHTPAVEAADSSEATCFQISSQIASPAQHTHFNDDQDEKKKEVVFLESGVTCVPISSSSPHTPAVERTADPSETKGLRQDETEASLPHVDCGSNAQHDGKYGEATLDTEGGITQAEESGAA